jgi:type I restriction enzyme S subunit
MVLRPQTAYPQFIQFALLSSYLKELQLDLEKMRAAQPHLNAEELGARLVVLPSIAEQTAIAAFLDRETAKIDALVAEQRRLIELLKEKRQAVISHAVTKGLNPHAPLKPSGIKWLGDVPEHWEVRPLKRFWEVTDCKHITAEFVDDGGNEREPARPLYPRGVQHG